MLVGMATGTERAALHGQSQESQVKGSAFRESSVISINPISTRAQPAQPGGPGHHRAASNGRTSPATGLTNSRKDPFIDSTHGALIAIITAVIASHPDGK